MNPDQPRIDALAQKANRWMVISIVSLFVGFSLVVGPLAWWQIRDLRRQLAAAGAPDHGSVRTAGVAAAVVTALSYLGVLIITIVLVGISRSNTY